MKKIALTGLLMTLAVSGFCQSFGEMLQTMLQQIAALEGYLKTMEKGYQIAESGLHTIGQIKDGEFNLHSVFFSSLESVNPKVGSMGQVAEVLALQIALADEITQELSNAKNNAWLQKSEVTYVVGVYGTILTQVINDAMDLINVTSDGKFKMNDAERMNRITAINKDMRTQSGIIQNLTKQINLLGTQRQHENDDIESVKTFFDVP